MTVDQAVESLIGPQDEQIEDAAPVEAAADPEPTESEAEPNPADDASEEETPGDGEEVAEPTEAEAEPVDPPQWWDAEAKAEFAKLTPEAQAIVFEQEAKRETITAKAKQEAAEARKAAESDLAKVSVLSEHLNRFLPEVVEQFRNKWEDVDWAAYAEQNPEAALKDRFAFEQEQARVTQLAQATAEADRLAHETFLRAESEKIKGTPLEDVVVRQDVGKYLLEGGIDQQALINISAAELTIAHKAMMWDRAQAQLKAKPPAPKPQAPAKPVTRAAVAAPQPPSQRSTTTAQNRFAQTRSLDDAVSVLLSMKR